MPAAEQAPDEAERLRVLLGYDILDTPREQDYDDLTLLASTICGTPTSIISLVDEHRQWFKASVSPPGMKLPPETPREISFCAHAILDSDRLTVVGDAVDDERFADNPLVGGESGVRFYAAAPLVARGQPLGTICVVDSVLRPGLTAEQSRALQALARQVVAQLELRRHLALVTELADRNRSLAETDSLTGLFNRRFFESELARRLEHGGSGALLIVDLDGFKRINDLLGHVAGDRLLVSVAEQVNGCVRAEDFVARLGGDEFAVVLGRISEEAAAAVVRKLSRAIKGIRIPFEDGSVEVSASIGCVTFERGGDLDALVRRADTKMYEVKRLHRLGHRSPSSRPVAQER